MVEGAVVVLEGVVIVVPEFLETFLFGRHALVAVREDVVPGLIAAVAQAAPAGAGDAAAQHQTERGANDQGKAFHRDSFGRLAPKSVAANRRGPSSSRGRPRWPAAAPTTQRAKRDAA